MHDEFLTEFLVTKEGNKSLGDTKLDPDDVGYSQPDFGFNYDLDFEQVKDNEVSGAGWRRFMDCVSVSPKYERVKNYIDFVNTKKIQKLND